MHRMVFTQILRGLIVGLVSMLFISCASYRVLQVEILQPPKIQIGQEKRILLLDRGIRLKDSPVVFQGPDVEISLLREFANGLNSTFVEMEYDTVTILNSSDRYYVENNATPLPFPADTIRSLCRKFDADYVISIEMQYFENDKDLLMVKWFMRLYQNGDSVIADSVTLINTLHPIVYADSYALLQEIEVACWDEGANYARRIVPYWTETARRVYTRGKVLRMGDVFLQENRTDEAIDIWKGACKLSGKTAIQARINLAWVYENAGDFDTALAFLQEAQQIAQEKNTNARLTAYLQKYILAIRQRILHFQLLEQQINTVEK